jgi:hypothetical protein
MIENMELKTNDEKLLLNILNQIGDTACVTFEILFHFCISHEYEYTILLEFIYDDDFYYFCRILDILEKTDKNSFKVYFDFEFNGP